MPKLRELNVRNNNVEIIAEDTLWDLPRLIEFDISYNKLETLEKNTFEKNLRLERLFAGSNEIEFLPEDLFKNNEMLQYVQFDNNKLTKILVDFRHLKVIQIINLRGNICTDYCEYLDRSKLESKLIEFQDILVRQCNG